MAQPTVLELMLGLVSLEGSADDRRVPDTLSPRSLFPEPLLYISFLDRLHSRGAITLHEVPWHVLWTQWFSASPWRIERFWQLLREPRDKASPMRAHPALALRLYRRVQLSDAVASLSRELSAHGFSPRWAADAAPVVTTLARSISPSSLASSGTWAVREVASAYLKGTSPFELSGLLKMSLARHAELGLPNAVTHPPASYVTSWMIDSLQEIGLDYWTASPGAVMASGLSRQRKLNGVQKHNIPTHTPSAAGLGTKDGSVCA